MPTKYSLLPTHFRAALPDALPDRNLTLQLHFVSLAPSLEIVMQRSNLKLQRVIACFSRLQ